MEHPEIRWADTQKNAVPPILSDGIPFMIMGKKKLACQQGKDRWCRKKETIQATTGTEGGIVLSWCIGDT